MSHSNRWFMGSDDGTQSPSINQLQKQKYEMENIGPSKSPQLYLVGLAVPPCLEADDQTFQTHHKFYLGPASLFIVGRSINLTAYD